MLYLKIIHYFVYVSKHRRERSKFNVWFAAIFTKINGVLDTFYTEKVTSLDQKSA